MIREILRHKPPIEARGDDWDSPPIGWAIHGSLQGWFRATGDYPGSVDALLQAGAKAPAGEIRASEAVKEVFRKRSGRTA
jgi:hypothetical protein